MQMGCSNEFLPPPPGIMRTQAARRNNPSWPSSCRRSPPPLLQLARLGFVSQSSSKPIGGEQAARERQGRLTAPLSGRGRADHERQCTGVAVQRLPVACAPGTAPPVSLVLLSARRLI